MRNHLYLVLFFAAACSSRTSGTTETSAASTSADNDWSISVKPPYGAKWSDFYLTAPQSTPIATFFAQGQAQLASLCPSPCAGVTIGLTLVPSNVKAPPPPDHAYSAASVQHYLDGIGKLMTFLPTAGLNAASIHKSLDDTLGNAETARVHIDGIITQFNTNKQKLINDVSSQLKSMAAPIVGQEMAQLADTKQKTQLLQQYTSNYSSAASALSGDYQVVTGLYKSFRATEASVIQQVSAVATSAGTATLDSIDGLQQQLRDLDKSEAVTAEELNVAILRLKNQLQNVQQVYDSQVDPLADFLAKNSITKPDATSVARTSLGAMSDYCLGREQRVRGVIAQVNEGLSRRVTALLVQATDKAVQPTLLAGAQLQASQGFVDEVNGRLAHLWDKLPTSTTLKLSFTSAKYDEMVELLQLEPMCSSTPPAYMQTGCLLLKPQFTKAHDWINKTAPSVIRIQALMLKNAGADASKTTAITTEVNAGQVRQAAYDEDVLLRATDLPTSPDGGTDEDE
jgi:hypothetical protein